MCLLLVAIGARPAWPLLLLGNRDEFHARPSVAAAPWPEAGHILGGRDEVAGGSWLALATDGRFAAVTNVRRGVPERGRHSRGVLVADFVQASTAPEAWLASLARRADDYAPFNLLVGDRRSVWSFEGPTRQAQRLAAGLHVLSNGPLDAPWPKMRRLRGGVEASLADHDVDAQRLLALLADESRPADAELPDTGIGLERERFLASVFIRGEAYGTRASTFVALAADGGVQFRERRFGPQGAPLGEDAWQLAGGRWRRRPAAS